jgi:hypothetical protein
MELLPAPLALITVEQPVWVLLLVAPLFIGLGVGMVYMAVRRLRDPTGWRRTGWWSRHEIVRSIIEGYMPPKHRGRPTPELFMGVMQLIVGSAFFAGGLFSLVATLLTRHQVVGQ